MKHLLITTIATVFLVGCGPSRAEREMFGAVLKGNIAAVKQYLDNGVNVNAKNEPGLTPLHWAVNEDFKGSHRELAKLLIDKGADVKATDDILQMADSVTGPWEEVAAESPHVIKAGDLKANSFARSVKE